MGRSQLAPRRTTDRSPAGTLSLPVDNGGDPRPPRDQLPGRLLARPSSASTPPGPERVRGPPRPPGDRALRLGTVERLGRPDSLDPGPEPLRVRRRRPRLPGARPRSERPAVAGSAGAPPHPDERSAPPARLL